MKRHTFVNLFVVLAVLAVACAFAATTAAASANTTESRIVVNGSGVAVGRAWLNGSEVTFHVRIMHSLRNNTSNASQSKIGDGETFVIGQLIQTIAEITYGDCVELLLPTEPTTITPDTIYESVQADLVAGVVWNTNVDLESNPMEWGAYVDSPYEYVFVGTACGLPEIEVGGSVTFMAPDVTSTASCPTVQQGAPSIYPLGSPKTLAWETDAAPQGCQFNFQVTNANGFTPEYGVVNILTGVEKTITTTNSEWGQLPLVQAAPPILDATMQNDVYVIAYPTSDDPNPQLPPFTDAPSTTIGPSLSTIGQLIRSGTPGTFTSIMFDLAFQTWVVQSPNDGSSFMPVGNSYWVWRLTAVANFVNGKWTVDTVNSQIEVPQQVSYVTPFEMKWSDYIQDANHELGKYEDVCACYVF